MAHFKLKQKNHAGDDPYYSGTGMYFGISFVQIGDELVAEGKAEDLKSLVDGKKVSKLTENAYKELLEEAEED